jgi:signal transduction histidine kinase
MSRIAWRVFLVVGIALSVAYLWFPRAGQLVGYDAIGLASAVALWFGGRRRPPATRAPWYWLAAGMAFWVIGDAIWSTYELTGREAPYPSIADYVYLLAYPAFAVGLLILVRRRRADVETLIDAGIVAAAAGLVSWVVFIHPVVGPESPLLVVAVSAAYPIADLLILAVLARMVLAPGARTPAYRFLLAGLSILIVGDVAYSLAVVGDGYTGGGLMDVGWLAFYVAWGTAALHPSLEDPSGNHPTDPARYRTSRLVLLLAASLLVPLMITAGSRDGLTDVVVVAAIISVVLIALVATRVRLLVSEVETRRRALEATLIELRRVEGERAQLLDMTVRAAEDERTKIAGELHDGPIQHLAVLSFRLQQAKTRIERGDGDAAGELIGSAIPMLGSDVGDLRRMMTDLRPPALDAGGIQAALSDLAADIERRSGIQVDVRTDVRNALDHDIETIVYRVAQEALQNAARHSSASAVGVDVGTHNGSVELVVRDDGRGFDPTTIPQLVRDGHFGIAGMRERVQMAGGACSVESEPGGGTTVHVRLPVKVSA